MRVTNRMVVNNLQKNISDNLEDMNKYNQRLSTGKKHQNPSDNPIEVTKSMQLKSTISQNKQYQKNIDHAETNLLNTEEALSDAVNVLEKVRENAIQGANETLSNDDRHTLADNVDELNNYLLGIANSKVSGEYLFSGTKIKTKPYNSLTGNFQGNSEKRNAEIAGGITLDYNVNGNDIFGPNGEMFDSLDKLSTALRNNDTDVIEDTIGELDNHQKSVMDGMSKIGAKNNRLTHSQATLKEQEINFTKILSKNEDADIAQTITDLKLQENVYQASLKTSARIMQPTLVDFL